MEKLKRLIAGGLLLGSFVLAETTFGQAREYFMYVGTYTSGASKGIYAYRFQTANGTFSPVGLVAETPNPSFLAAHPNGRWLYAVNEQASGTVSAFGIDR